MRRVVLFGLCGLLVGVCGASTTSSATASSEQSAAGAALPQGEPVTLAAIATRRSGVTRAQILRLLSGIPQEEAQLGSRKARVTLTLYGDLECPVCHDLVLGEAFRQMIAKDVRAGRVRVIYRSFQTATFSHSVFVTQQVAALAAGRQQRFWQFAMLFLREQGAEGTDYVTEGYLDGLAHAVPALDFARWQHDRRDSALAAQVRADERRATRNGIVGTPTLIFHGPRGSAETTTPLPSYRQLEASISSVA
jgi:protein-disulfide isomerase